MNVILVGINAKFSHINLAIRLIKSYADINSLSAQSKKVSILISEWNINIPFSTVVRGILEKTPTMVLFSTYIWNREYVFKVIKDLHSISPEIIIGMGGPEVSWSLKKTFLECAGVSIVITGEGERPFCIFLDILFLGQKKNIESDAISIPGVSIRNSKTGEISECISGIPIESLDDIPFPFSEERLDFNPENKLVYYESSRGCPFNCAYCLSSLDKTVRYYPIERVLSEIDYFMKSGFPLIKFVDRTFNLDPRRYLTIWKYIRDNYNGKTLFHFEISAEYLSDDDLCFLETMPDGAIQFEIGIQTINIETLKIISRPAHPDKLAEKIRRIPRTIHIHLDLIAGLPADNIKTFVDSFNYTFLLKPEMLQLGFLKILSGSPMEAIVKSNSAYIWSSAPPYEILGTPSITYQELQQLKDIEHVVDVWYNSALLRNTIHCMVETKMFNSPFSLFSELAGFIKTYYLDGDLYFPRRSTDSFSCMASFICSKEDGEQPRLKECIEYLKYDFLVQGKPGIFPKWYTRHYNKTEHDNSLIKYGLISEKGNSRRIIYSRTEYDVFHFSNKNSPILFIYPDYTKKEKKVKIIKL